MSLSSYTVNSTVRQVALEVEKRLKKPDLTALEMLHYTQALKECAEALKLLEELKD